MSDRCSSRVRATGEGTLFCAVSAKQVAFGQVRFQARGLGVGDLAVQKGSVLWTAKPASNWMYSGAIGDALVHGASCSHTGERVSTATPLLVAAISGIEPSIFQYSNSPRGLVTRPFAWNSAT